MEKTALIFQGGGPTPVINASLAGFIKASADVFDRVLGLPFSLELIDQAPPLDLTGLRAPAAKDELYRLANTPGSILGSSRKRSTEETFKSLCELVASEKVSALVGIGGNGTMDVLRRASDLFRQRGLRCRVIGIPKTVDNDLTQTHVAPGFGSAARYVCVAARNLSYDVAAMSRFDDVTILETMGRNTGWLASAAGANVNHPQTMPDFILFPERPVDPAQLVSAIVRRKRDKGWVYIVTNEMLRDVNGDILGKSHQDGPRDDLGRSMYSLSMGTSHYLAQLLWRECELQTRVLRPGILGRVDTQSVSEKDRDLAWRCGREACAYGGQTGEDSVMISVRTDLSLKTVPLDDVKGVRSLPPEFVDHDNYGITDKARAYLLPLIGEIEPIAPAILPLLKRQERQLDISQC